jgi:hypothetical protein
MDTIAAIPAPIPQSKGNTPPYLLTSLAAMTGLADFAFWRSQPGLSVAIFTLGAAGLILLHRPRAPWTRQTQILLALIAGASIESALHLCFTNILVAMALLIALAGETSHSRLRSGWSRWSEAVWNEVKAPFRSLLLLGKLLARAYDVNPVRGDSIRATVRVAWIVGPGLAITAVFAFILGNGNALFAKIAGDFMQAFSSWIENLDIGPARCFFWGFVAMLAIPLLWPGEAPEAPRLWTREIPSIPQLTSPQTSRLQSAVTLGLLNLLFCFVNTIDAIYLWAGQKLPPDVYPAAFLHQGVASLITAVLLSALLLALTFQQVPEVAGWRPLQILAMVWITQNILLLASVFLRTKLYVHAFDLTVTRVHVVYFLLLVTTGFLLLAIKVWQRHTLGWLLNANVLATFFLFYTVQFLDTRAFVARYNVDLWQASGQTRHLDLNYLESLGPSAYGAIETVAESSGGGVLAIEANQYLQNEHDAAQNRLASTPWPSLQLRDLFYQRKLINDAKH